MAERKLKQAKRIDYEDGAAEGDYRPGFFEMINSITYWTAFKYLFIMAGVCLLVHFTVTIGQVTIDQGRAVMRYRQVAIDELSQPCCKIFHNNQRTFSVPPVGASQVAVYVPSDDYSAEQVMRCQRILSEEKAKSERKVNRCESSEDILRDWIPYQVFLKVWEHYLKSTGAAVFQQIISFCLMILSNIFGGVTLRGMLSR